MQYKFYAEVTEICVTPFNVMCINIQDGNEYFKEI